MTHLSLTVMAAKLSGQATSLSLFVGFHEPPVSSQTTAPTQGVGS